MPKIFFSENRNEIKRWYKYLCPFCVLSNIGNDFEITKDLGKGNFSIVHLGIRRKTGEEYAIKSIYKEKIENKLDSIESIINEIVTLRKLSHPQIIKLFEVYETDKSIHLVF